MTEANGDPRALIEQVAKFLVDQPDQVSVTQVDDDQGSVLELEVALDDVGKVIGRQGRVARALRNLLGAAGVRANKRFTLEIVE